MTSDFTPAERFYSAFVSLVVVIILGAQLVVGLTFHGSSYWPIVSYPMYARAHYDGDRLKEFRLFAETGSGERIALDAEDFGYSFWIFRKNVHLAVLKGQTPGPLLAAACAREGGGISELVLEDLGYFITRDGLVHGTPEVVRRIPVDCPA
jgi:hypothetical protein